MSEATKCPTCGLPTEHMLHLRAELAAYKRRAETAEAECVRFRLRAADDLTAEAQDLGMYEASPRSGEEG